MSKKLFDTIEIENLKDMLNKTKDIYSDKIAYKIRNKDDGYSENDIDNRSYVTITHRQIRNNVNYLGTALIDELGLKDKRIAVIGENRYEWELAYLAVVCGTGVVVPLDKALPENELESLIKRSEVEAIFYSEKYENVLKQISKKSDNKLKFLISMDAVQNSKDVFSQLRLVECGKALVENGDRSFIDANIDNEKMSIMLFTSGTTSSSKVVALSHRNIASNLMDIGSILDVNSDDVFLSILPVHHVFECTVGFLFSLYKGASTVFCDGIRHLVDNLKEYHVSIMACVPGIYERIFGMIRKQLEKQGKLDLILENEEKLRDASMEDRKKVFSEIHNMLGGNIKLFISGAAALDAKIEEKYRLLGLNLVQGYGLTETSPVVAVGTNLEHKIGSIGKAVPSDVVKLDNVNADGIGELVVKGPNVALGYYGDEEATSAAFRGEWFYTGDLARIDEEGYIFICGRKKSVIVLKNGKNIFPEEMEALVNKIDGVSESFVFGKQQTDDKENIKIFVKVVYDEDAVNKLYNTVNEKELFKIFSEKIKEINKIMPKYKSIRGLIVTKKPLLKTTTNKIKRQANLDEINKFEN